MTVMDPRESEAAKFEERLMALGATRTVYSFYYPEVREIVDSLWGAKPHFLYEKPYMKTVAGLHLEFADAWRSWSRPVVKFESKDFPHFYPTAGSSEAIRDSISHLARKGGRIHVFRGEYEGYRAYANAFGAPVVEHDRANYVSTLTPETVHGGDWFFLSQPSSLDGNQWKGFSDFVTYSETLAPRLALAVDLCYVGSCAKLEPIRLESPVIRTIFFSLSKSYGVYFHRIGGILAKDPSPSLVGNEYFRNNFSLLLGKSLMERFPPFALPSKYREKQLIATATVAGMIKDLVPSDVTMLASRPSREGRDPFEDYVTRQSFVRVCLTPGLDRQVGR